MNNYRTIWTSKSTYIDIDTGEILRKSQVILTEKYIIIKTTKKETYYGQTKGHIEYTVECRRNPQGNLFSNNRT